MRWLKRTVQVVILVAAGNFFMGILMLMDLGASPAGIWLAVLFAAFIWVNLWPMFGPWPTERIRQLSYGCELLTLF